MHLEDWRTLYIAMVEYDTGQCVDTITWLVIFYYFIFSFPTKMVLSICLVASLINPILFPFVAYYCVQTIRSMRTRRFRRGYRYRHKAVKTTLVGIGLSLWVVFTIHALYSASLNNGQTVVVLPCNRSQQTEPVSVDGGRSGNLTQQSTVNKSAAPTGGGDTISTLDIWPHKHVNIRKHRPVNSSCATMNINGKDVVKCL